MAKIYTKDQIHQLKDMVIFFDANILIYLFMPTGNLFFETAYSSIFALLLKEKNTLIIDFLVLSEFINRASRIDHEKYLSLNKIDKNKLPYKKYRDSADGQEKLQGIYDLVSNKFLKFFQIIEHGFNHDDITKMLNVDSLDFNPCFSSQAQCLDWAKKNGYSDKGCVLCN